MAQHHNSHPRTAFDTFPWPQTPTKWRIAEVLAAAVALRYLHPGLTAQFGYPFRKLYHPFEEPSANPFGDTHACPVSRYPRSNAPQ